jgi:HPt (histidine-containing phosphotransfer) domain-containing protein
MNKFIPMADGAISNIITACEERNADKVNFNSHKLKSSARTVGANELASICLELEVAGKNSDWDSINELYEKLIPAMNQVKDYINKL